MRQLGPDIISTVINVIILIIKTFHISIAGLYLRQCRGYDDVNHRSRIRTDTTCHNRYPPPCARHTAHHSDDIKYYFILPAVNMNCAALCSSRIKKPKISSDHIIMSSPLHDIIDTTYYMLNGRFNTVSGKWIYS